MKYKATIIVLLSIIILYLSAIYNKEEFEINISNDFISNYQELLQQEVELEKELLSLQ